MVPWVREPGGLSISNFSPWDKSAVRGAQCEKGPQTGTGASNSLVSSNKLVLNDAKAIEEQVSVLEVAPEIDSFPVTWGARTGHSNRYYARVHCSARSVSQRRGCAAQPGFSLGSRNSHAVWQSRPHRGESPHPEPEL